MAWSLVYNFDFIFARFEAEREDGFMEKFVHKLHALAMDDRWPCPTIFSLRVSGHWFLVDHIERLVLRK
jgi:hypothetical protein